MAFILRVCFVEFNQIFFKLLNLKHVVFEQKKIIVKVFFLTLIVHLHIGSCSFASLFFLYYLQYFISYMHFF